MKILFLPKYYIEGASSRYRTHNYIEYFERAGHDITIKPLFFQGYVKSLYENKRISKIQIFFTMLSRVRYLLANKHNHDLIVIEKELFPFLPFKLERWLLKDSNYTLDYDDAVSTRYRGNRFKEKILGNKINFLSDGALLTTVGNRWYWNEITRGNLEYLPTVINLEKYPVKDFKKVKNDVPIITWIGSPSTMKYLEMIKKVLIDLSRDFKFKLRVIGAKFELADIEIEYLPWSDEREFEYLFTSDIGIMPLHESPWEYGKCGFKCIQYMASELPVVASALPANEEIIKHGETGFIAKEEIDWYKYLKVLLMDHEKAEKFGKSGRKRIENFYSYQVWGPKYIDYINQLSIRS